MDVSERIETHGNVNDIHSVSDVNGESHGRSFRNKAFELDEVLSNSPISNNYTIDDGHKKGVEPADYSTDKTTKSRSIPIEIEKRAIMKNVLIIP